MSFSLAIGECLQLLGSFFVGRDFIQEVTCGCHISKISENHDEIAQDVGLLDHIINRSTRIDLITQKEKILNHIEKRQNRNLVAHFISRLQLVVDVSDAIQHQTQQQQKHPVHSIEHQCVNSQQRQFRQGDQRDVLLDVADAFT